MAEDYPEPSTTSKIEEKPFDEQALNAGLNKLTITKLAEQDFDSIEAFKLLRDQDVEILDITRGQLRMLLKWRDELLELSTNTHKDNSMHQQSNGSEDASRDDSGVSPQTEVLRRPLVPSAPLLTFLSQSTGGISN